MSDLNAFDEFFMQKAINLASKGIYTARPNPVVGCVIVKNKQIIGEGFHQKSGENHAEINALNDLKKNGFDSEDATCYVTLEPCSHVGKTPPCVDALIKAKIKKVVIASTDTNPKVSSIGRLKAHGIEVLTDCLKEKADALNQGFLKSMAKKLPFVRLKLASSIDGKTALLSGESKWITNEKSRLDVQKLRARSGAIITGIGTILADNPSMTVRVNTWDKKDMPSVEIKQPLRVIFDRCLTINPNANILHENGCVWLVTKSDDQAKINDLTNNKKITIISVKDKNNPLKYILEKLVEHEIYDVLVEAGHQLSSAFLKAELVDEFWLYQAPILMGNDAFDLFDFKIEKMKEKTKLKLLSVKQFDDDLRLIYKPVNHKK